MNLHDTVQLMPTKKHNVSTKIKNENEEVHNEIMAAVESMRKYANKDSMREGAKQMLTSYNKIHMATITEYFSDHLALPSNIPHKVKGIDGYDLIPRDLAIDSIYTKMDASPKSKVQDLVDLSNTASLIIIPFNYLDKKSYSGESYSTRNNINEFVRTASKLNLDVYAIAPLRNYSILEHLQAEDPNGIIVGNKYQQNFDVLSMMMPAMLMFADKIGNIVNEMNNNRLSINALDSNIRGVARGLESMQVKLKQLEAKIEQQQLEAIQQKIEMEEIKRAQAQAKIREYENWYMVNDPLLFAVKGGSMLNSDDTAIVGPCWGSEFDAIVAQSLDLKIKAGQRKKLAGIIESNF